MNVVSRSAAEFLAFASRDHRRASFVLVLVALAMFLPGFFTMQPMDRDEPRFAQATKQMLETGDFVDIRLQDEARHKKPVGIYWLQSLAVSAGEALGVADARRTIWLYRLPSLAGAVGAILLAYWAFLVLAERRIAFAAALLFASSILLGVEARLAKTDAFMCATAMAAMAVLARAWMLRATGGPTRTEVLIFWAAIGVSFLLKGPVIMMIAGLAAAALAWRERSAGWLKPLAWAPAVAVAVLIVLPWFVAITVKSGGSFFAESLGRDMIGKVGQGRESHFAPPGAYLLASLGTFWPGSALILLALPAAWRERADDAVAFCLAWVIPSWIVFETVPTKLPHYVLPLMPALAFLAARTLSGVTEMPIKGWRSGAGFLLPAIPALLLVAGIAGTMVLEGRTIAAFLPVAMAAPLLLIAILLAAAAWRLLARGAGAAVVPVAALASLFVYAGIYGVAWSGLRSIQISPRLADAARAPGCAKTRVAVAGYYEPSLVFLTSTDLKFTDGAGAAQFLAEGDCRVALVVQPAERTFNEAVEKAGVATRLAGRQHGFNINGARRLDIGVYVRDGGK